MTLLVSDVAQDVLAFLGRPSQSALPRRDLFDVGSRKVTSIVLDLFNSDRDYRVEMVKVSATKRDSLFPFEGEIVRLEGRPNASTDEGEWATLIRTDYADWRPDFAGPARFATYNGPDGTHLVLSGDPAGYEFRALVERGTVRLSDLGDDTTLSGLVQPLLFTRWALEAGAMVADDSDRWEKLWARKERHLRLELPGLEKQWKVYVERSRGEGVLVKEGFGPSAYEDGGVYRDSAGNLRAG